jgi:Carboxypeptidase regulatory-like domain
MKVKLFLATAAACASVLSAAVVANAMPAHMTSVIGGRVVDSINQRPLSGVQVDIFDDSVGAHASKAVATTVTKGDGTFSLPGLHSGTYHIELVKRGYALEIITGFSLRPHERVVIPEPFGMRSAVVTTGVGRTMETTL